MNKILKKIILSCLFFVIFLPGCLNDGGLSKEKVIVKGSDTMVNLTLSWAEEFMKAYPGISIQITGGGSGTGIASILNGTADAANISRELKPREIKKAAELGVVPKLYKVALDGIAVIVHPSNNINTLSITQIRDIFSGKIKNWEEVGGEDKQIVLYGRENSSGTYEYFKEVILESNSMNVKNDFAASTQVLQGTSSLAEAVSKDIRGIGYGGVGYFAKRNDLKIINIKTGSNITSPMLDGKMNYNDIWNGSYPLARYLYCLTNGEPEGALKKFIVFITSQQGQKIVENMEYIPLPDSLSD